MTLGSMDLKRINFGRYKKVNDKPILVIIESTGSVDEPELLSIKSKYKLEHQLSFY